MLAELLFKFQKYCWTEVLIIVTFVNDNILFKWALVSDSTRCVPYGPHNIQRLFP
jgi:hypothetical protein